MAGLLSIVVALIVFGTSVRVDGSSNKTGRRRSRVVGLLVVRDREELQASNRQIACSEGVRAMALFAWEHCWRDPVAARQGDTRL
jgi:hypothetical protein